MATPYSNYEDNYWTSYTTTKQRSKRKPFFYIRCIKWLWENRDWANTRQKFKAMDKECNL